jgi:transcriptional regulator GlxA family with amidase domain
MGADIALPDCRGLRHFGFLTLPSYSMIAFANAIEVLRIANYVEGHECYRWTVYTIDGSLAVPSNGVVARAVHAFDGQRDLPDVLIVCGGMDVRQAMNASLRTALHNAAGQGVVLGGLCSGVFALLAADLMEGYRCAAHWEDVASLAAEFPGVQISDEIFVLDRDRMTCASGAAPVDMMLNLVAGQIGAACAAQVSRYLCVDRIRAPNERQISPVSTRLGGVRSELVELVELMETNVEEPLSSQELARLIGVSDRHMQRMFREQIGQSPSEYYLTIRLKRARTLLLNSAAEIRAISLKCGFNSACSFSKATVANLGTRHQLSDVAASATPCMKPIAHPSASGYSWASSV